MAIRLLVRADIELVPARQLASRAVEWAILLDHSAYDCMYLTLAEATTRPFVTADARLLRKLAAERTAALLSRQSHSRNSAPGPLEERVRRAAMALLAIDVRLHPGDLRLELIDIVTQLLDPERVEHQLLQPHPLADRTVVLFYHHANPPIRNGPA